MDNKEMLRTAAERLLAMADGATLEWVYDGTRVDTAWPQLPLEVLGGDKVRIRPPAAPPEPKPSQDWLDYAAKWDCEIVGRGPVVCGDLCAGEVAGGLSDGLGPWKANSDMPHLTRWKLRKRASLPCPPEPKPSQTDIPKEVQEILTHEGLELVIPNMVTWNHAVRNFRNYRAVWLGYGNSSTWHMLRNTLEYQRSDNDYQNLTFIVRSKRVST